MEDQKITTTLGALADTEAALRKLSTLPLAEKPRYHVAKLVRLVAAELVHFHDRRNALIREYGEPVLSPGQTAPVPETQYRVKPAAFEAFFAQVAELAAVPVVVPWAPVSSAWLTDPTFTAADLLALGPLVELVEPKG